MSSRITNLVVSVLGDERVTNGDFSTSGTWTYGQDGGDGWSYDAGDDEADCSGDQTAAVDLEQNISAVSAERYLLSYEIKNWVAGTLTPQIGGVNGVAHAADGTWETYITATNTGNLKFQADSDFNGSVDTVSVKKVINLDDTDTISLVWTNADSYDYINIEYDKGSGWVTYVSGLAGDTTSYDIDDIVTNTLYIFRLRLRAPSNPIGSRLSFSNTDSAGIWTENPTAMVIVSPNIAEYVTGTDVTDEVTATVYVTGVVLDAISLKTNYAYYVGSSNGKVYQYSADYKSDAGTSISARWESKDTDFADQSIEISDRFKTVEFARLHYIDKTSSATVSVLVSTDGGATWTPNTKSIGSGDGKGKTKDFHFITTGQIFRFAVENASTSDEFQWAGLDVFFSVGGNYFEP